MDFADIVHRMMAKDPAVRLPSARAVAEALRPWRWLSTYNHSIDPKIPLSVSRLPHFRPPTCRQIIREPICRPSRIPATHCPRLIQCRPSMTSPCRFMNGAGTGAAANGANRRRNCLRHAHRAGLDGHMRPVTADAEMKGEFCLAYSVRPHAKSQLSRCSRKR